MNPIKKAKDYVFGSAPDPRARDIILLLLIEIEKLKGENK